MKNNILLFALSLFLMVSCSDWTEIESIELKQPNFAEQNPELYAQYTQGLRDFKKSDHKATYVFYDNSVKQPTSRAHHITDLPDSIDVISLSDYTNLEEWELEEIKEVQEVKGTKVIFTLDFDAIKLAYERMVDDINNMDLEEGEEKPTVPSFVSVLVETVNKSLASINKYNLDGVSMAYKGKAINHMTEEEKRVHTIYENAFIKIAEDWQARNSDKMICFEGNPQNLIDKSILEKCEHILLQTAAAKNGSTMNYILNTVATEDIPVNKFIVMTETPSLDPTDENTGFWANGTHAMQNTAEWILSPHSGIEIAGIAIKGVKDDYFNSAKSYMYTRMAINTINPSPKK